MAVAKLTYEFDLDVPDEAAALEEQVSARDRLHDTIRALRMIRAHVRTQLKHGELSEVEHATYTKVEDVIYDAMDDWTAENNCP